MKEKLIEVLSIQTASYEQFRMFAYLIRELKRLDCAYYTYNGCIYATKGYADVYPCVVAHMDTVHDMTDDLTVVEIDGNLTGFNKVKMEQTGIGGDDKVGIFVALQCLENFDNIKVAFFRDEEVGCEGSYNADVSFFDDCRFVLQCDRRGYGDFITSASGTELSSKDFQNAVSPIITDYGYEFENGMMTDVMALKELGIGCSMANISCGYYNPHMDTEYVNVLEVQLVTNMVFEIISKCEDDYPHKYKAAVTYKPKYKDYTFYDEEYEKYDKKQVDKASYTKGDMEWDSIGKLSYCDDCGNTSNHFTYVRPYNSWVCDDCYVTLMEEMPF